MMQDQSNYSGSEIRVLKGLEPVRVRPGMYIGSTGKAGLNHLVYEIVDNAVDEHINGYCDEITVILRENSVVEVTDNGRGIPVDMHPTEGKSTLEVVMTVLHAGGKFDKKAYKISGGLHGVGASVVNALSEYFEVRVHQGGNIHYQRYQKGFPDEAVKIIGQTEKTGTHVIFKPDATIFDDGDISVEPYSIEKRLREIAFLNSKLTINFIDEKRGKTEKFHFEGGLTEFLDFEMKKDRVSARVQQIPLWGFYKYSDDEPEVQVELTFGYTDSEITNIISFVNNIRTVDGGEHEQGFKIALTRIMNDYARKIGVLKEKDENFTGEDVREGIYAIVHVKMANPVFEGQTKAKLGSKIAREAVNQIMNEKYTLYLDSHQADCKAMLEVVKFAAKKRLEAKKARENVKRKSVFESSALPGKLADCLSKDLTQSELFIVEGDSAGGNAKQARDRNYQAILPLRGKILNTEKSDMVKILKSEAILNIVTAIGGDIGENFDLLRARYGKIIIMTDADVDGSHITTLLLTLFFRHMRPLVEEGRIFIAQPPLYKFEVGKQHFYLFTDKELEELKAQYKDKKYTIQRYKGLGEMSKDQLWETTMNRDTRKIVKITVEDLDLIDQMIEILMGEDATVRREFIEENAHRVKELDI